MRRLESLSERITPMLLLLLAIGGALLVRATGRARLAVALGTLYAISDEMHQSFVPMPW